MRVKNSKTSDVNRHLFIGQAQTGNLPISKLVGIDILGIYPLQIWF